MLELKQQATTDSLTGLTNRRALEDDQPSGAYALLSFDIDFFNRSTTASAMRPVIRC